MELRESFLPGVLPLIYYFWVRSLKIRIFGSDLPAPVVYLFWHSRIFPLPYTHRRKGIGVLVSEHADTIWIERILRNFGFTLARGSFTRGGTRGALSLFKTARAGRSIAITPDGPKGPKEEVKESIPVLLNLLNVPVIPVGVGYSRKVVFQTWDEFQVPFPHSKCAVLLHEPLEPRSLGKDGHKVLTNRLKVANSKALKLVQHESFI